MKAKIDKKGMLIITPESEMEDYALECWCENLKVRYLKSNKSGFCFEAYNDGQK